MQKRAMTLGAGCIWFPTRFSNLFLCKPEPITRSRFNQCLPSSSKRRLLTPLHGNFGKSIPSANGWLRNYSQMKTGSVSSTPSEGRIKRVRQDVKGQVHAVDVAISDEGRGVVPLRGQGSDRARALPHVRDCGEVCGGLG